MYPNKLAIVQSDEAKIIKTFLGQRPVRNNIDPRSLAAGFFKTPLATTDIRCDKAEESIWFRDGRPGAYVVEESIYDPSIGNVLSLLTVI